MPDRGSRSIPSNLQVNHLMQRFDTEVLVCTACRSRMDTSTLHLEARIN